MTLDHLRFVRFTVDSEPDGGYLRFEDLRIDFEIRSNADEDTAPSLVRIYNLSFPLGRSILPGHRARLEAGYGSPKHLLYAGGVRFVAHERNNHDRITEIFLGSVSETASIDFFRHSGATVHREIVIDLVQAMGLEVDIASLALLPHGGRDNWAFGGRPQDGLKAYLSALNLRWRERDGVVYLERESETPLSPQGLLVSERTVMIGSPSYLSEERRGIRVRTTLTSQIRVGDHINVESEYFDGGYIVTTVTHMGDNWEGDWYTELEAEEIELEAVTA